MKLFVCLDEVGGMTFNKRRQSSDRIIRDDMLQIVQDAPFLVNSYTAKQFTEEQSSQIQVDDNCLENASEDAFVFVENIGVLDYISNIEQIIVYRWQRKYPADFFFDVDLKSSDWELVSQEEIVGYSHECILKEVYKKVELRKGDTLSN